MDGRPPTGSHPRLVRPGWSAVVFAYHDEDELGSAILAKIAKDTGLRPDDL
jgi:predicted RNA binding protein YcfA (HicA-like mRNA interferase family)